MYAVIFLWLIFYDFIEASVPMINYWDELAACLVFLWGVYDFRKHPKLEKGERINWICLIALVGIGILGNIVHPGLQENPVVFIKDIVALCKFPMIFFLLERRTVSTEKQEAIISSIAKTSRWLIILALAAMIAGRFVDLGVYHESEVRFFPVFQFVFSHPTFFISAYVMVAAALIAESIRKNRVFLLIDCLLLFMAQRSKGYIFIVVLLLFTVLGEAWITKLLSFFLGSEKAKVKPVRVMLAVAVLILMILIAGRSRIEFFLSLGLNTARMALHVVGVKILIDFFPLGSGLGTFASYLSGENYSNVYALYGIDHIWGMTKDNYNFISDVFWPYIYGQFGIFGFLIYITLIIRIFFRQYRSNITNASRLAVVTVWIYSLIASTSEAYFTNGTGVQMALFLGLLIGYGSRKDVPEKA